MARVYYREEKIYGTPVSSDKINAEIIDYILDNCSTGSNNISEAIKLTDEQESFLDVFRSKDKQKPFRFATVWNDGFYYEGGSDLGKIYLPKSIIFYDVDDVSFPSEYYFIAKVGNQVELRRCNAGKDVQWSDTLDMHVEESHPRVVARMEKSVSALKELVETVYNKSLIEQQALAEAEERRLKEENRAPLDKSVRDAYKRLANICLPLCKQKADVVEFIDSLKSYDDDEDYMSTLNYVMEFLDSNDVHFIMSLDWKAEIEDLEWRIESALKYNFKKIVSLPSPEDYESNASISFDGVFKDFDKALRSEGFQISLIDTQSDEYVILVHPSDKETEVNGAVRNIGYGYNTIE